MTAGNPLPLNVMNDAQPEAECRWEVWSLVALGLICAAPVWAFHYFPSTDGGAHLANADVLLQYLKPAGTAYRNYYELSHRPLPNSLGHFLLAGLMLVVKPTVAEKLLVTAYVIGLPLAVRYALRAVRGRAGFLAFMVVPLSLNWILHQGFYNFCCSVIAFFVLLGYWLRHREEMTVGRAIVLGILGLVLYAGHLLSIVLACAAVGILAAWFTVAAWWTAKNIRHAGGTPLPLWPGVRSRLVVTFIALLPAIALVAWFQLGGFAGKPGKTQIAITHGAFWKQLFGLSILVSYRARPEKYFACATAALFIATFIAGMCGKFSRREGWRAIDGLILVPVAFAGLYFTRGDLASAQLFIPQRLVFYTYLTLLPFLAAQPYSHLKRKIVATVAGLLAIGLTVAHLAPFKAYNEQLAEFVGAAERVGAQSTVLPLIMAPRGTPAVSDENALTVVPFYTAAGYAAIERKAVDLRNYEAGLDYFPVKYKAAVNPYTFLGVNRGKAKGLEEVPQRIDVAKYEHETPGRVEWVVVWGPDVTFANPEQAATAAETLRQVREGFELVYTSEHGRAQVWRRKP